MNNYQELKKAIAQGWNTWNTRSVLSHVLLPEGFAINLGLKEYKDGHYLKEALIGRFGEQDEQIHPGDHAYDGSYTSLQLKWKGIEVQVQSATIDQEIVLLITPLKNQVKPATLVIESGMLWNRQGILAHEQDYITAKLLNRTIHVYTTGAPVFDAEIAAQGPYLSVKMDEQIGISTGKRRKLDEIKQVIEVQKQAHAENKEKYTALGEAYHAMQSCMAWDTIYEPQKDRVITPVSRLWNVNSGGYALFCWDTYFAAYMASTDNKALAYSNAIEITKEKTEEGFVPNCAWGNGFSSRDRSQPPVGSFVVRELYRKYRDVWLIEELFDDLYKWNTWFLENRAFPDGTMAWGSHPYEPQVGNYWETTGVNDTYGAALESGLDNSPMYDDIPFGTDKHVLKLADVGLVGLYILDCEALADIAVVLDKKREATELKTRGEKSKQALTSLWDEKTGIFLNKRTDTDEFSYRLSPTNFYALYSDRTTNEQADRMLKEHFYNPEEFWGDWIMPSIARNDPAYKDQDYWRGRIWAPMNFLVYIGFRKHNLSKAQHDLADKSKELILKEWVEHGHVHENYNGDTGEGCDVTSSDKFYHWGGLLAFIALIEAGYVEGPEKPL
ncbi:alpha,alpha-trehalase [Aquibacillus koreensis]|uniref:Alpha,alpha-trehalase n=1 Tax=Aquibacillus koreensis TaxID=279446 RepID=A0A9X4AI04_9BACI|nr:alpha,alpha-trehalase [Aquibacillus koreensis]MCT2536036.1 alpha,alpha-trehalase [Aquibacillus koreensis]MDC3420491.1 alpha,alpha-trehalase [Aquibacillus koreensis]